MAKQEGIRVSPSAVRRIRCQANIPPKRKRRPAKVHRPRERKLQTGMFVQIDGSFHGRIERLFQTLQDRWVVELRLRGIQTLEEANQVLPELIKEHNEKIAVAPLEPESAFVPLEPGQSLDLILCFRDLWMVGPGETISYRGKTYILDVPNSALTIPAKTPVEVRKTLDGKLFVWYKGKPYPLKEATRNKAEKTPEKKKESSEKKILQTRT